MAKSKETFGKKENESKKRKKQKEKEEKRMERKANSNKGKGLEMMMAYIDENGNLSDAPPDPAKMREVTLEEIQIDIAAQHKEIAETTRKGIVAFLNESKGYGFITDLRTQERIFVHVGQLSEPIKERDKVSFEAEKGPRGLSATNVKKIK